MTFETLKSDWAIWLALVLLLIAAVPVARQLFRGSSPGQLRDVVANLRKQRKELHKATADVDKAEKLVRKLTARADKVKPRVLQEARDTLEDKRALLKIAKDQIMVAENHVRRVIHEEYSPQRHDELRERFLPSDGKDKRPFSF